MNRQTRRYLLFIFLGVSVAVLLSLFFWPEWTDWKIRLGVLIVAVSITVGYRERPLSNPNPQRIPQEDPSALDRQRLKNWANSWR